MKDRAYPDTTSWKHHLRFWLMAIITLLSCTLIAACDVPGISGNGNSNGVGNGNTGNCNGSNVCNTTNISNPSAGTSVPSGASSSSPTPLPTPTPSPSPTPTPEPRVYKANWSSGAGGWVLSGGWNVVSGMLINDGSQYSNDGHPDAIAPYPPQDITNYSVQVDIRLDRYTDEGNMSGEAGFGVVVRSPDQVGGDKIGVCASGGIYSCGNADHELIFSDGSFFQDQPVKQFPFRPAYGGWHTYRMDVQGNTFSVWVDGTSLFQVTDDRYLSAGSVGLWSDRSQISVRNFAITAL